MKSIKLILKYIILFLIGGALYCTIEILFRGYTHESMFFLGAICFLYAGFQNEYLSWDYPFWRQLLKTWIFVVINEFVSGLILNVWLGLNIWDYSNIPGNILGQISMFDLLFIPVCAIAIVVDDWIRYLVFEEERPRYNFKLK